MSKGLPKWVAEEVQNASWETADTYKGTGYFLDINPKEKSVDIQFYDTLPEGRHIVTADIPGNIEADSLIKGEIYLLEIKRFKFELSGKVKQLLEEQYQINMEVIYRYELTSVEKTTDT